MTKKWCWVDSDDVGDLIDLVDAVEDCDVPWKDGKVNWKFVSDYIADFHDVKRSPNACKKMYQKIRREKPPEYIKHINERIPYRLILEYTGIVKPNYNKIPKKEIIRVRNEILNTKFH